MGFMLDNIGPNQLAHGLINSGNRFLEKNGQRSDIVLFIQNIIHPVQVPNFAHMNISESYDYNGNLVATSLNTAVKLLKCVGTRKRFFYVWDLEWTRPQNKNFAVINQIYNNPLVELIARSHTHSDLIELCWKKPIGVIEDGKVEKFYELFEKIH
jgi:hypothetical protein